MPRHGAGVGGRSAFRCEGKKKIQNTSRKPKQRKQNTFRIDTFEDGSAPSSTCFTSLMMIRLLLVLCCRLFLLLVCFRILLRRTPEATCLIRVDPMCGPSLRLASWYPREWLLSGREFEVAVRPTSLKRCTGELMYLTSSTQHHRPLPQHPRREWIDPRLGPRPNNRCGKPCWPKPNG